MERKYDLNTGPKENYVADSPISDSEATLKKRSFVLLFFEISKPLFICKLLVSVFIRFFLHFEGCHSRNDRLCIDFFCK